MSKRARKLYQAARRPLTAFLTLCLVLEMMPAQGVAYALEGAGATEPTATVVETEPQTELDAANVEQTEVQQEAPAAEPAPAADPAAVAPTAVTEATSELANKFAETAQQPVVAAEPDPVIDGVVYPAVTDLQVTDEATGAKVTVSADKGVLPEGVWYTVDNVTEWDWDDIQNYSEDELTSMLALRLHFYVGDWSEVAPKGEVRWATGVRLLPRVRSA